MFEDRPTPVVASGRFAPPVVRPHARLRILAAADRLFYYDGVHTVGVDRVIAEAEVTKATFYKYYRSKDNLVVAYLKDRDQSARDRFAQLQALHTDPGQCLRRIVQEISSEVTSPSFRGCPFINAAAQFTDRGHPVRVAVLAHREWVLTALEKLFTRMGHERPGDAADEFLLARDGAFTLADLDDPVAANAALQRVIERVLLEASA